MGIRFTCHHCSYAMHVKDFQGGKRGKCPHCSKSFRIPLESAAYSIPILDGQSESIADAPAQSKTAVATKKRTTEQKTNVTNVSVATQGSGSSNRVIEGKVAIDPCVQVQVERKSKSSIPEAFANSPNAAWYVRPPSGGQYGPADQVLLKQWIQENRVTGDSLVWREGQPQWILAADLLPELYRNESKSVSNEAMPTSQVEPVIPQSNSMDSIASPTIKGSSTSAAALTAQRKLRKRRQQWIAISILACVSLCLCVGLIIVLFK